MTANQLALDFSTASPNSATPSANDGPSSKMSLAFSAVKKEETLLRWLEHYLGQQLTFQTVAGKTPALHLGQKDSSSGQYWTRNSLECRSGGGVSLLSEILETGPIDPRFYLSATACKGILGRAEKRGKTLPAPLRLALEAGATETLLAAS
jgi:hypothetical protein